MKEGNGNDKITTVPLAKTSNKQNLKVVSWGYAHVFNYFWRKILISLKKCFNLPLSILPNVLVVRLQQLAKKRVIRRGRFRQLLNSVQFPFSWLRLCSLTPTYSFQPFSASKEGYKARFSQLFFCLTRARATSFAAVSVLFRLSLAKMGRRSKSKRAGFRGTPSYAKKAAA